MKTAEQIILAYDRVYAPCRVDLCITHPDCEAAMEEYAKQFAMSISLKGYIIELINGDLLIAQNDTQRRIINEFLSKHEKLETI